MSYRTITLGFLAAAGLAAFLPQPSALAADLDYGYGTAPPPLEEEKVEFGSGWYIRGDIAATHGLVPHTNDDPYDKRLDTYISGVDVDTLTVAHVKHPHGIYAGPGRSTPTITTESSNNLSYTASIGGGYQFNKWFRTDVVFDFHQPTKTAITGEGRECITGMTKVTVNRAGATGEYEYPNVAICTPTLQAALKSYDALVNGYIDLGTWGPVTPYIGAGVGLSFGTATASATYVMNNGVPYQITYTDALNGATYYQNWDRKSSVQYYNLAYALMAGVSYDVFDHTKLDIGYRYLRLGKVLGASLNTQEVHAGLRYMIDN